MLKYIEKYPIASLVLFVVLMLGFTIDVIPVSIMEARNFISAREMLMDDHWILTTMNGHPRYEKPPLPTWITAYFGLIFGIKSVLALRWPALLFASSIGVFTYLLSKKITDHNSQSIANGFIVLTSFYVIGITIEGTWDIYTHGFMLMALYQLFILFKNRSLNSLRSLLFIIFIAASILSKGPVSLYALFLPFIISYGIVYSFKGGIVKHLKLLSLLLLGITTGAWWYLYVRSADPETFLKIATKETSNWSSYNVRPFYYYWSFFTQSGLWTLFAFISLLYPYMKSRVSNLKAYRFSLFWTLIAVILLSLIPEKKSRYLMPVLIPLAITIGFYVEYIFRAFKTSMSKTESIAVYVQFGLVGFLAVLFPMVGFLLGNHLTGLVLVQFLIASIVIVSVGIFIFKHLKAKNIKPVFYVTMAFMMSIGLLGLPLLRMQAQSDYNPISKLSEYSSLTLYSLDYLAPEVIYNYGNKIPSIKEEDGIALPSENSFHLLTNIEDPNKIRRLRDIYTIEYIETYDLNFPSKDTRGYKDRLVNKLYKLTRK
ncbi:glycosyltransferase [Ichthyenterobacterium sp. W332]|uniref:Glycosyltransferase n=1 Tax=Microcosmobacter mediterraneus TaxID=3075607 RepID=A0ABU2YG32_9FLAO|nr:glycosyltransferase [Ichthyenterobacterium sp. W332]MDT0557137.1 glycosyltransferase [Ichthyenterobacterium sp. W332]